jgi:RNA recognition motif-containing protein
MVLCVRQNIVGPDDASRMIHESAALLQLQLSNDLPVSTVILSGMRKTVNSQDVIEAFRKFGPIEAAAVASKQRGFGIVRFKNKKSVEHVLRKFQIGEIVVQDVAVQVKALAQNTIYDDPGA